MKTSLASLLLAGLMVAGCAHRKAQAHKSEPAASPTGTPNSAAPAGSNVPASSEPAKAIVTPDAGLAGKVARYNEAGGFVVLEFPVGHMPALQQRLFVYRGGLKIAEIKVTGPQRDDHIVADVTSGEAQAGDEVRDK